MESNVIYVTSDDVTCMNCQKQGHVARNCHTTAHSGFADNQPHRISYHTCTTDVKHREADTQ
jgi:hypothetical protein